MKIHDYTIVDDFSDDDVLLVDGARGTKGFEIKKFLEICGCAFKLAIDSNGRYGYVKNGTNEFVRFVNPNGTLNISANGIYDVSDYEIANIFKSYSIIPNMDSMWNIDADIVRYVGNGIWHSSWSGNAGGNEYGGSPPEEGYGEGLIIQSDYKLLCIYFSNDNPGTYPFSTPYDGMVDIYCELYTDATFESGMDIEEGIPYDTYRLDPNKRVSNYSASSATVSSYRDGIERPSKFYIFKDVPAGTVMVTYMQTKARQVGKIYVSDPVYPTREFGFTPLEFSMGIRSNYTPG